MKNNTPAVLWYYQDFETGTIGMTPEEVGLYVKLLNLQNIKGHFPLKVVAIMLPTYFNDGAPCEALTTALEKFERDSDGNYFNARMETEIVKRNKYQKSRKRNLDTHMGEHMESHMESHMETETEIETETEKEIEKVKVGETVKAVLAHLNDRASTAYRARSKATVDKVKARMNEGYTLNDFITVIDNKCDEWIGTEYEKYLRPATLFGTKFESYLNQKPKKQSVGFMGVD